MSVISTNNAEHYIWGDACDGWHLLKTKHLSIIQERMPAGASEVSHYHKLSEQFFYVISGIATLEVEGALSLLEQGQGMHIPKYKSHKLSNQTNEDLIFIVTSAPSSKGDRFQV